MGIRRCPPLMSSGTRAVCVVRVGIIHHGWHDGELQNQRPADRHSERSREWSGWGSSDMDVKAEG